MCYRYYIVDIFDESVTGTDSTDTANDFAKSEDYLVLDSLVGQVILEGKTLEVENA
jgi:hypothetical protein